MGIRMLLSVAALLGALLLSMTAQAEEPAEHAGPYDPASAWKQSLGYTAGLLVVGGVVTAIDPPVGTVVLGLGVAFGPSIGHFYIDHWGHALGFAALRLALGAAAGVCIFSALEREPGTSRSLLISGGAIAGAAALALAIFDVAVVARHAREANRAAASRVALAPSVTNGGGTLSLIGRF
jgi:hypothetical protein